MTAPAHGSAPPLRLGLIGDNIAASRAPRLHVLAGTMNGRAVTYDRLVPPALGHPFETVFDDARAGGYHGLNITYPYKERVTALVEVADPLVRAIGAINTVIFGADRPQGHNSDFSGFVAAYRGARGTAAPGRVLMIGTGGVGRAVAFGLLDLGVAELRLLDRDRAKAEALASDLRRAAPGTPVRVEGDVADAADGVNGVINCTPVGMVGYDGTPLPAAAMPRAGWAFDAVYTPADTRFLADAVAAGLVAISGWELFFWQGVHAWRLFSGQDVDEAALRATLLAEG